MSDLTSFLNALSAKKSGTGWVALCPAHDDQSPSLSIGTGNEGKILFKCHAGCSQTNVLEALKILGHWPVLNYEMRPPKLAEKSRGEKWQDIWEQTIDPLSEEAKPLRSYLERRGLPNDKIPNSLRYHPSLEYFEGKNLIGTFGAMIALVTDVKEQPQGILRTYLTPDGEKAPVPNPKKGLGSFVGGKISFSPVDKKLCVGEGVETCLSVFTSCEIPTWSAISANFLRDLEIPPTVEEVHIFADKDRSRTGQNAANELAKKLTKRGVHVFVHIPRNPIPKELKSIDWLDAFNTQGVATLKESYETTREWRDFKEERKSFNLITLKELFEKKEETTEWLVSDLLPCGGISIIAGKPKAGKTTLARQLALSVANGEDFLGFKTLKGPVIYLALEEKESEILKHFRDMGATGDESILVHAASAPKDALEKLCDLFLEHSPILTIIDPLFRFTRLQNANDYSEVTNALEAVVALARDSQSHLCLVHHMGKAEREGADGILGSTAIVGAVDAAIMMTRKDKDRFISSMQRYGTDIEERALTFNPDTRKSELGGLRSEAEEKIIRGRMTEYLHSQSNPVTENFIKNHVTGKNSVRSKVLRDLVSERKISRSGKGGRGSPFLYLVNPSSQVPRDSKELGNQNSKDENMEPQK